MIKQAVCNKMPWLRMPLLLLWNDSYHLYVHASVVKSIPIATFQDAYKYVTLLSVSLWRIRHCILASWIFRYLFLIPAPEEVWWGSTGLCQVRNWITEGLTRLWLQSKRLGKQGPETESQFTFSPNLLPPARWEGASMVSQLWLLSAKRKRL